MLCALRECGEQPRPVEVRARVGLATRRDVAVRSDIAQRQPASQLADETREARVLSVGEDAVVDALELDADGKIVAAAATAPGRGAGMPRAALDRHELHQLAVAADQEMRGDAQVND